MQKHHLYIIAILILGTFTLKAQDTLPSYQSKQFRSLDLNIGMGLTYPKFYPIPINIVYQQNVKRNFSWIVLSKFYARFNDNASLHESYKSFNWVEAAGFGVTLGNKRINNGLFIVGGARFYHSKLTLDNSAIFHEPTLVTTKLNPELGLLYNLKIGKKKVYFTTQIYIPMLPFKNFYSNPYIVSIGVGYRFKGKV